MLSTVDWSVQEFQAEEQEFNFCTMQTNLFIISGAFGGGGFFIFCSYCKSQFFTNSLQISPMSPMSQFHNFYNFMIALA